MLIKMILVSKSNFLTQHRVNFFFKILNKLYAFADCSFSLRDDVPATPVILRHQKDVEFFYPNTNNSIRLAKDGKLVLHCIDRKFEKFDKDRELLVQCIRNTTIRVLRKKNGRWRMEAGNYALKDLECSGFPKSVVRKQSDSRCYRNSTLYDIGFRINNQFLKVMTACFDDKNATAVYTWYNNTRIHTGHKSGVRRPLFEHDNLYDFNVSATFSSNYQQKRLHKILKSKSLAKKYVKHDKDHFMSRGHLTPKADFVFGCEQAATFHYINAAPQWQIFNGGNWASVEENVRSLVAAHEDRWVGSLSSQMIRFHNSATWTDNPIALMSQICCNYWHLRCRNIAR